LNKAYVTRATCRLCGAAELEKAVSIGLSPVSEKYVPAERRSEPEIKVPLDLFFCHSCSHVQLVDVVEAEFLWSDYTFRTADNARLVEHFADYVSRVQAFSEPRSDSLIVDIGSNDGTLLKHWKRKGFESVLGIDPAPEIGAEANAEGIETIVEFFDVEIAKRILTSHGYAEVVTANNVYAHCDDLVGMTEAIRTILHRDGIFVFEASYLLDIIEKDLIGTIFHEHLSYHSVLALDKFFRNLDLELIHVERGPEQGGSIVGYVQHVGGRFKRRKTVQELIDLEIGAGLDEIQPLLEFDERLKQNKRSIQKIISEIEEQGGAIAGFGAARAGTTLLTYYDVGKNLDYLLDDNESKQYRFSPGERLEVLPTSEIYRRDPSCIVILAWLHADKVISSHKRFVEAGGRFVRLFPTVEVVSAP